MTVIGATQLTWKANNLHPREIVNIFSKLNGKEDVHPRLDMDLLNVYHNLKYGSPSYQSTLDRVAKRMHLMASYGFIVTGVVDGPHRPDCKRSSWDRTKNTLLDNINSKFCRQTALSYLRKIEEVKMSRKEVCEAKNKVKQLNAESDRLANQMFEKVPATFKEDLEEVLFRQKTKASPFQGGYVEEKIIVSEFQADSMISYRILNDLSDIVYGNDTDYFVLLGPKHFTIRKSEKRRAKQPNNDDRFEIAGSSNALFERIKSILGHQDDPKWGKVAGKPALDLESPLMRALVAVTMGNDVWKGQHNFGPAKAMEILDSMEAEGADREDPELYIRKVLEKYNSNEKVTKETFLTLASAVLCEPAVEHGSDDFKYLYDEPSELPKCLKYFKSTTNKSIQITKGPCFRTCGGICGHTEPHYVLDAEESYICGECGIDFCRTCGYVRKPEHETTGQTINYYENKKTHLCFGCYKHCTIEKDADGDLKTIKEMREELASLHGKQQMDNAEAHEIEEMYDEYKNKVPLCFKESQSVPFPVKGISFFDEVKSKVIYNGPAFSENGFLSNEKITVDMIPDVVALFAEFLKFKPFGSSPYCVTCPEIVIDFANKSRTNVAGKTAHKLIKGAVQHSNDELAEPILRRNIQLFKHQSTVGMVLENTMPPSMKHGYYDTKIAFTTKDLLACDCTCLSSGKNSVKNKTKKNDGTKVTCVHNLPLLMQLHLALDRGYVSHFLYDVAAKWSQDVENKFKRRKVAYNDLFSNLRVMVKSALNVNNKKELRNCDAADTIIGLLRDFKTGTNLPNIQFEAPPDKRELTLFRDMPVISNARALQEARETKFGESIPTCQFIDNESELVSPTASAPSADLIKKENKCTDDELTAAHVLTGLGSSEPQKNTFRARAVSAHQLHDRNHL